MTVHQRITRTLAALAIAGIGLVGLAPSASALTQWSFNGPPAGWLTISGSNQGGGDWRYAVTTTRNSATGSLCLDTKRDASWDNDGYETIHRVCSTPGGSASTTTYHTYNPPCGGGFDDFVRYRVVAVTGGNIVLDGKVIDVPDC